MTTRATSTTVTSAQATTAPSGRAAPPTPPGGPAYNRTLRRLVPAVPTLSRNRWLMWPMDLVDRAVWALISDGHEMPPNRMRLRVGAGNRLLGNQLQHRRIPVAFWMEALASKRVTLSDDILDLGCGCGRYAHWLMRYEFYGSRFRGTYTGLDVDPRMIDWCARHFDDRFRFHHLDQANGLYHPSGKSGEASPVRWPVDDASRDFVFSVSVLTHLLEGDLDHALRETARVLRPGGNTQMTVFCTDHLRGRTGGRWTFAHRMGDAHIESPKSPEAAVAYSAERLTKGAHRAGLTDVELIPGQGQSMLRATKPGASVPDM